MGPARAPSALSVAAALICMLAAAVAGWSCEEPRRREPGIGSGEPRIHGAGILEPTSPEFHGTLLRRLAWDFDTCRRCHGDDFRGGTAGLSCTRCHEGEGGPTACETCHDDDLLASGAHSAHLGGGLDFGACGTCHTVPGSLRSPGHLDDAASDVTVGFDPLSGTCSVPCHGSELDDPAAAVPMPSWTDPTGAAGRCGACHGLPPRNEAHARDDCATCHQRVIAADRSFVEPALHLDFEVQVGDGDPSCAGCHVEHGGGGAHARHALVPSRLSDPVECAECHPVPPADDIVAAGHFDSPPPVEVLPVTSWNAASRTCADAWCHGATVPRWEEPVGEVVTCGSCHGIPPASADHDPALGVRDCSGCHPSVDDYGNPIFEGGRTRHLDGRIDVR